MTGFRTALVRHYRLVLVALGLLFAPEAYARQCAAPSSGGNPAGVSGVVNTYFPGTASVAAGATMITLGAGTGAATPIGVGDLLLVIQIQGAAINSANDAGYGNGSTTDAWAHGFTTIGQTGRYEYVRAMSAVGVAGGTVTIMGGTGAGTTYGYVNGNASATAGQQRFQVVRVPQYANLTLTGTIVAQRWNGTSGGIAAIDVANRLTFSGGGFDVSGMGFRGGGGRQLSGGAGAVGDYRALASVNTNAAKGEGIAGTPRFLNNNGVLLDTAVEGYPNGSQGRGAPGNAGGGGTDGRPSANDQNTGGGGGGNAGIGGKGGNGWCGSGPEGCSTAGGEPGGTVPTDYDRIMMGGGGGAGTSNNATGTPGAGFASSGAAGGGIVLIRAGEIAGSGTVAANGAAANSTVTNDATGGGGAGGSVAIAALRSVAGARVTVQANGGAGGTNTGGGSAHGPGGGGGGGVVSSTPTIAVASSTSGGASGRTVNGGTLGTAYGAMAGANGVSGSGVMTLVPGISSGGECTPTVSKSFALSPIIRGNTIRMTVSVTNNNPDLALTGLDFTDSYPAGLVNGTTPAPAKTCTTPATFTAAAGSGSFRISAASIAAASTCSYSVATRATSIGDKTNTIPAGGVTGLYGSIVTASNEAASAILQVAPPLAVTKTSAVYSDPLNGTVLPKAIPGGFVTYSIGVSNPGGYSVSTDSLVVIDATPANLRLFIGSIGPSGPVEFVDGATASTLAFSFASLDSTTDDVEFFSAGAGWSYVPAPDESGADANVTRIRIRPRGTMAAGSGFTLRLRYRIG